MIGILSIKFRDKDRGSKTIYVRIFIIIILKEIIMPGLFAPKMKTRHLRTKKEDIENFNKVFNPIEGQENQKNPEPQKIEIKEPGCCMRLCGF
jgi:hypothetical protein